MSISSKDNRKQRNKENVREESSLSKINIFLR